jgi:sugar/nucleoside kinase (ribokinase family)
MEQEPLDFVGIGDITTDAFIRIKEAKVTCDMNHEDCQLCVKFGDKIPYEFVEVIRAVGNSANAAVSAARLGLSSALIANVGDDTNGKECIEALTANNVQTQFVTINAGKETNYHYVLWYEDERTILVKHQAYDYVLPEITPAPRWIYLSSLGENALSYEHDQITAYLRANPDSKLAFQPGTFQMKQGYEAFKELYMRTELFFCNTDEARRILENEEQDIIKLLKSMHDLGPKIVVITDGPKGAYAYDGTDAWQMPIYPDPKAPYERTGAGDAFASTVTVALALGKTLPEALMWGPINSMSVVQSIGAQKGLLSRDALEKYLDEAPESYKAINM